MNPENPSRPEIEAKITALLLGELPEEEARLLRYAIGQDAGLQKLHDRLQLTIGLVREVHAKPTETVPLKLSDERRKKLLAHFKTPRQSESIWVKRIRIPRLIEVLVVVAIVVMLAAMLLPALSKAKYRARRAEQMSELQSRKTYGAAQSDSAPASAAPAATPPPPPGEAPATGSVHSENVGGYVNLEKTPAAPQPVAAPAPTVIVLPNGGPTENQDIAGSSPETLTTSGRQTEMRATQKTTAISGVNFEGDQTAAPMPSMPPPASMPAQIETAPDTGSTQALAYNGPVPTTAPVLEAQRLSGVSGAAAVDQPEEERLIDAERRKELAASDKQTQDRIQGTVDNFDTGTQPPMAQIQQARTRALKSSAQEAAPMAGLPAGSSGIVLPQMAGGEGGSAGTSGNYGLGLRSGGTTGVVNSWAGSSGGGAGGGGFGGGGGGGNDTTAVNPLNASSGGQPAKLNFYNGPAPGATRTPSVSGSSSTVENASESAGNSTPAEIDPNTGLPFKRVPVMLKTGINPGTSAFTFDAGKDVMIDPNTGLPVNAATGQPIAGNPLGQFPGQSSGAFALDVAAKTPAGDLKRDRFYRTTNGLPALGDIPVTGQPMASSDTTFSKRTDQQAGQNANSSASETELAVNRSVPHQALGVSYDFVKANLEQSKETEKLLESKIKAESVNGAIPQTTMAQVTEVAKPATNRSLWQKITGEYASTARIQVQSDGGVIQGLSTPAAGNYSYDPYFIQTTFEVIQSQAVLSNAIAKLNLNDTWGKKYNDGQPLTTTETTEMLKGRLSLTPVKNTKLINITVTEEDPKEAAALANAIAQSYADFRAQQTAQVQSAGLAALKKSYLEESNRILALQAEIDRQSPAKVQKPDAPLPQPAPDMPIPQPEVQVKENAFSTFSLNVSDVSFQLAAASLEKGRLPEAASVRSEEFINAFDYRDPAPDDSQRIAFHWERAHDPFAHNRDFLRFSLKTAATGRQPGRPLNLVLLLDDSGSMERADRVAIIQEALRILATQLQPQDTLSIVTFARTAHLWADGVPGDQAGAVLDKVSGLTPEGGTNLEEAMRLAYETARRHYFANGMNRVVLITDGAANLGDVDVKDLKAKVEANRKQGIALDCFGIGWEDYNDNLLEQLSSQGDGRYAFLNTPGEAHNNFATKLAGALQIAASGVKVQVEFNPQRTISYRQIGYATHQLTRQQFRDNTIAAGEIAAAEAGNALYTVETDPAGDGPIAIVRVRYQIPGTTDYREQTWDVPYTGHAATLEQASPAMRLAATSAAFSEWLAASPYAAEVTPDQLLNYLNGVPAVYSPDEHPKKLEWMIRQAKSLTGK